MTSPYDRAQLAAPLAFNESEFSWYIFEGRGRGRGGARWLAGLAAIHRTGPRVDRVAVRPTLITGRDLPKPLRGLIPDWLPILSPVEVATDDRPLCSIALYDLDAARPPRHVERAIEHAELALDRFAAATPCFRIDAETIHARTPDFDVDLRVHPTKPPVVFGDGSPRIVHGSIVTSYVQKPRLSITGTLRIDDEVIEDFTGDGVHDHQWLAVTAPNLKWLWPHLRLPDGRELTGYVIRDSSPGRFADADTGRILGRGGWLIERDATVRALPGFDVRATAHTDTDRGRVPTQFAVDAPELGLHLALDHLIPAPYLRMRAFGDALDAGIYEGPVRVHGHPDIHGWVEVMNAATVGA